MPIIEEKILAELNEIEREHPEVKKEIQNIKKMMSLEE